MIERPHIELTQEIVRELLDYDLDTRGLTWKWRERKWFLSTGQYKSWNTQFAGKPAFTGKFGCYATGSIFHKTYYAHRVIWLYMTGLWLDPEIDHDNHIRSDNRWVNLFEATDFDNNRNRTLPRTNTTGRVGVYKAPHGTFEAKMNVNGGYLGTCPTFEAAVAVRQSADRQLGFRPNHSKPRVLSLEAYP
jgi:HNH endonuclease